MKQYTRTSLEKLEAIVRKLRVSLQATGTGSTARIQQKQFITGFCLDGIRELASIIGDVQNFVEPPKKRRTS